MLLCHLAYPAHSSDIYLAFSWEISRFSCVTRTLATYIYHQWLHILQFDPEQLNPAQLAAYAEAVYSKGAALSTYWGFVDGTLQQIARPTYNQRIVYNRWKRIHGLKFHLVVTLDELHSHLFGPVEGRQHNSTVYYWSGLTDLLDKYSYGPDGLLLVI
ncbi:hypothetical protein BDV93DRAFT_534656 [Ceratobasidium sp. AG-I]|nr:hypothetical protein BDV93DRAFT_534656 [Ceratobasidium sp. AG-I]